MATSTHKTPTRQEVINELIDDRLKIAKAKVYGMEVTDAEVDGAFESMASAAASHGCSNSPRCSSAPASPPNAVKARIRAEITWNQLVRGKFGSSLQVGEGDIANALMDTQ